VKTRRKKTHLLRDAFQYRIIAVSLFYQLVVTMTFAAALFVPTMMQLDGSSLSSAEAQQAAIEFLVLHKRVWPALLVAIAVLAAHAVLFSHRIAGPLYRFRTIFKAVTEGNLTVFTSIRKGDYLQREAECLRVMVVSLHTKVVEIETRHSEVRAALGELSKAVLTGSAQEVNHSIEQLRKPIEHLTASLGRFRTNASPGASTSRDDHGHA
jgi:methyl-accepting chemotaxis protein